MKKFLVVVLVALLLGACGATETKEPKSVDSSEKSKNETNKEETKKEEPKKLNQEIADTENIKATLISVEKKKDDVFGDTIEVMFEVENKRDDTIEIQAREVSADGKMVDEGMLSMSQEISGGKKADATLTIQSYDDGKEIPELKENLEMILYAFSWDNMDFEEEHNVKIDF